MQKQFFCPLLWLFSLSNLTRLREDCLSFTLPALTMSTWPFLLHMSRLGPAHEGRGVPRYGGFLSATSQWPPPSSVVVSCPDSHRRVKQLPVAAGIWVTSPLASNFIISAPLTSLPDCLSGAVFSANLFCTLCSVVILRRESIYSSST